MWQELGEKCKENYLLQLEQQQIQSCCQWLLLWPRQLLSSVFLTLQYCVWECALLPAGNQSLVGTGRVKQNSGQCPDCAARLLVMGLWPGFLCGPQSPPFIPVSGIAVCSEQDGPVQPLDSSSQTPGERDALGALTGPWSQRSVQLDGAGDFGLPCRSPSALWLETGTGGCQQGCAPWKRCQVLSKSEQRH